MSAPDISTLKKSLVGFNLTPDCYEVGVITDLLEPLIKALENIMLIVHHEKKYRPYKNKVKLCVSQIKKVIPEIYTFIEKKVHPSRKEIISFLTGQLNWCVKELVRILDDHGSIDDEEPSRLFVFSMDTAISSLTCSKVLTDSLKEVVDDILCQALTIAKLSIVPDYDEISTTCLRVLESMNEALDKRRNGECSEHYINSLLYSLETLERKVNVAVLRLFLHVMSEHSIFLKELVQQCYTKNLKNRNSNDLDDLISKFDLQSERINLMGQFAIACTDDNNMKFEVQSCLAGLESCENVLIPAVLSSYMDHTNYAKREFLKYLTVIWLNEVVNMKKLLDNIVDTYAFLEVVQEDLSQQIAELRDHSKQNANCSSIAHTIYQRFSKLIQHLSITDEPLIHSSPTILTVMKKMQSYLKACECFSKKNAFLKPSSALHHFELLLICVEELQHIISIENDKGRDIAIDSLSFPESVNDIPLDISTPTNKKPSANCYVKQYIDGETPHAPMKTPGTPASLYSLKPYLSKVAEKTILRTTLYCKTPMRSMYAEKRHISFDISGILDNVSNLSDTFTTNYELTRNEEKISEAKMYSSSVAEANITNVDTFERFQDIMFLKDKINSLKIDQGLKVK